MKTVPSSRNLVHQAALAAVLALAILPIAAFALPICPSDGIARETSGSTATGSTCNEAYTNLNNQERAKMTCEYGLFDYEFIHNTCSWNGSAYQVAGWFEYECQTNCHEPQV